MSNNRGRDMEWEVSPQEYRYILSDFIRSGIHIEYEKVFIQHIHNTIYYPYITGRQYQVYKEYHFVSSENESWEYRIMSEVEAGDIEDYDIECFRNWDFFCESFDIDIEDESIFQNTMNYCYAFIFDYEVRFLDFPLKSMDIIDKDLYDEQELLDDLKLMGIYKDGDETPYIESVPISKKDEDIQKNHIFEIYENYNKQIPFYPIYMSLEWFYFVRGKRIGVDTILKSISYPNVIYQDDLMTNYVIDSFPSMSEKEIIEVFQTVRDNYAGKNKTKRNEWYVHTAALMNGILKDDRAKNIGKKVKIVRSLCNNQGAVSLQLSENKIPYLKHVLKEYKKKVEVIYDILLEEGCIGEETFLSDFKYYLTGKQESEIKDRIHWMKGTVELVGFISCICDEDYKVEWSVVSEIFYNDSKGETFKPDSLKTSKSREPKKQIDIFKRLFE